MDSSRGDSGVFELITALCKKNAAFTCTARPHMSQKMLASKMRSEAFEIILKKSAKEFSHSSMDPVSELWSHYYVSQTNVKNVGEHKKVTGLKRIIGEIKTMDLGANEDVFLKVLKLLVALKNSVQEDHAIQIFNSPFSFGLLDEMLPKPRRASLEAPQPYSYYPSYVFELPFSLKFKMEQMSVLSTTKYIVETYDSTSYFPENINSNNLTLPENRTFISPMSIASLDASHKSPFSEDSIFKQPRLEMPRDLQIPCDDEIGTVIYMTSVPSSDSKSGIKDVYRAFSPDDSVNIWELASSIDKDIPEDIWEIASRMPSIKERQLIASSPREVTLWRRMYGNSISQLNVVSEKQFIRHIMFLLIGIETSSFPFNEKSNRFYAKDRLTLEGISMEHLRGYLADLLLLGTYYYRLNKLAFNHNISSDSLQSNGLIFEAARDVIRNYLLQYRLKVTEIYQDCCNGATEDLELPTLLQILYHIEPLKYEIETVASIYEVTESGQDSQLPVGANLMSYFCNEILMITHKGTANVMFNALFSLCKVYFKFIERFIFEGELDDVFGEFFIRKDAQYVNCRTKRYWDKGYHITQSAEIPDFLKSIAKCILLCGKSLRLLKLCNPGDPLVVLTSTDHPSIKCCSTFDELHHQLLLLDVYRTRCLFVTGEPVTFEHIMLKRDAEKKAFTEMASLKQAETMEKIIAERKRLAQLIIAEKQHSFKLLEKAMEEAKAAKSRSKFRERKLNELEIAEEKAREEVDALIRDDEKEKVIKYYSNLNLRVEKSKILTEWKIKRLQLYKQRMQLLSTEERNLKREKIELEMKRNDDVMSMSTRSDDFTDDPENENEVSEEEASTIDPEPNETDKIKSQGSGTMFSAICNAAKSIFGTKKTEKDVDNTEELDNQGNIITEINSNTETSSNVIGSQLNTIYDNKQLTITREAALANKLKVLAHEFGQIDEENNRITDTTTLAVDADMNPFQEAKRNKEKVLGSDSKNEFPSIPKFREPCNDAQKEAILNKQKVLGVEYNLPLININREKEPANFAQEEAVKNRDKMCSSDITDIKRGTGKRAGLTLDLNSQKKIEEPSNNLLSTDAVTPGDLFKQLDIETPTTADIQTVGLANCDIFTPLSENAKEDLEQTKSNKGLTSEGFNFSYIVDLDTDNDMGTENELGTTETDAAIVPSNVEKEYIDIKEVSDIFNPFHITFDDSISLSRILDIEMGNSVYTHPMTIFTEVQKKPYKNIFRSEIEEEDSKINCDNIATLIACLQRSVLLPLSYQLEVVNNSILTHFLVNLDMFEHLRSLKDYFFLMDGEFSKSICHNLFAKLVKTINPQELLNFSTLHTILDKALGSSISHQNKYSENLSFTITEPPLSFQHSSPDVLECLSLIYTVEWPLNIILSQEALVRYGRVFQFLVKMRRISWVLGEDFECLKLTAKYSKEDSRKLLRSPEYRSIQVHRHIMSSFIRALDNYIVTTSILTSWVEFENDLQKARTLDDLHECHVVYIKKVLFRCLLNNRSTPIMKLLNDIFTVILKFSRVLKAGNWQQTSPNSQFTHSSSKQLNELFNLFEKLTKYLHKVITRLMECGYQRHLAELLSLINLNGFYDYKSKDDQNASVSIRSN